MKSIVFPRRPVDHLRILDTSILRKSKNVVILGNGGTSHEDDKALESADCVIRFNNYATRAGINLPKERTRCDLLFTTFDLHSQGSRPSDVVIGIPSPFKISNIIEKSYLWYPNSTLWTVNPYWNWMMCHELKIDSEGWKHPFPSVGFTCLWHFHRMGLFDEDRKFHIGGFNWYYDPKTKMIQNHTIGNRQYPSHWNHNYHKEIEWTILNLMEKMNINFSMNCQAILHYTKKCLTIS